MIPDFGDDEIDHKGVKLSCKFMAPGLTMHDLCQIFHEAEKEWQESDDLCGNPSKWKNNRGIYAVSQAILKAIYD